MILLHLGGFLEYPRNQTVCESSKKATFRCGHQSTEADINWKVNGLPVQNFPEFKQDSYTNSAGALLHTLTIPALLEYNKTVVQCVAFLDGATEKTPPVTLIIIPIVMGNYILSNTESACDVAIKSSASSSTGIQTI